MSRLRHDIGFPARATFWRLSVEPVRPNRVLYFGFGAGEVVVLRFSFGLLMLALGLAGPALAQTPYDGMWDVIVETKAGNCPPASQYRLTVQNGKVSGPSDVVGTVAHEGMVRVSLNGAFANGQLIGKTGSGKWNAAAAGKACSGLWQATKTGQ
jgi:hypothetical protein